METTDVVIAGAGIIGLSLALDLAGHGHSIIVVEPGRAMAESSWAAAGMLAANDPEHPPELAAFARLSLALYPDYLARIEQLSGRRVPLRTKAAIQAISTEHGLDAAETHNPRKLSHTELHALVPELQPQNPDFRLPDFLLLEEPSLDPRDLCVALPSAATAVGIRIIEGTAVTTLDAEDTGIVAYTAASAIAATHFVNCAGAWADSPALGRLAPGHPRITPAKGQMTTVRLRGSAALTHVLRTPKIYLVPRGDGRIAIGATVEHAGFDKTVEPHAIAALLKAAAELWPPIADAEILESWAGLRPVSADELPLIGPISGPNCWIASGHFRNGILLAPATAHVLSQLIRGENPAIDLAPFAPSRVLSAIGRPLDRLDPALSDNRSTAAL